FLLSKSQRYYFDAGAIREQAAHDPAAGRNRWDRTDYDVPGQTPQKRRSRAAVPPRHAACGSTQDGLDAAGRDGARNKRSVWTVATRPFRDAHFATFPEQLIEPCILAGAPAGGLVLDPFMGAGTTAVVAERLGRQWLGCELNPEYAEIAEARIRVAQPGFAFGETA
ncbi:MAG: site-specific DNA-methyltransferase, partial [Lysobacteraceae bacterium]